MDFSELKTPETKTIHIEHPSLGLLYQDEERSKPITVTVYGPGSDVYVKFQQEARRKAAKRMEKNRSKSIPVDELEDMGIEMIVAVTKDVSGIEYEGKKVTAATIEQVYRDPSLGWLKDQVAENVRSWEDFLG